MTRAGETPGTTVASRCALPACCPPRFANRGLPSSPQQVPVAGQRRLLQAQHHRVPTNAAHRRACDGPTLCVVPPFLLGRWRLQPDSGERADRAEQQAQLHRLRTAMRPHGHRGRRLLTGAWTRQDRIHRRQGRREGRDGHHAPRKGARAQVSVLQRRFSFHHFRLMRGCGA